MTIPYLREANITRELYDILREDTSPQERDAPSPPGLTIMGLEVTFMSPSHVNMHIYICLIY